MNSELLIYFGLMLAMAFVAWIAQWGKDNLYIRYLINGLIGVLGALTLAIGAIILFLVQSDGMLITAMPYNMDVLGWLFILMGCSAVVSLIPFFRKTLAHTVFPGLDASFPVHTWALYIFLAALILTVYSLTFFYNPDVIVQSLTGLPLMWVASVNMLCFILFSFFAQGLWAKKSFQQTAVELGFTRLPWKTAGMMLGIALLLAVGIQILEGFLLPLVDENMRESIQKVVDALKIRGSAPYIIMTAAIVGLAAGIGEEILFRGLLQPVFGVIPTALLFTLIHTHYGPTVLLLELFAVGAFVGLIRQKYNTWAAIIVHAGFDFFVISSSVLH